jgi:hypothetical protein
MQKSRYRKVNTASGSFDTRVAALLDARAQYRGTRHGRWDLSDSATHSPLLPQPDHARQAAKALPRIQGRVVGNTGKRFQARGFTDLSPRAKGIGCLSGLRWGILLGIAIWPKPMGRGCHRSTWRPGQADKWLALQSESSS